MRLCPRELFWQPPDLRERISLLFQLSSLPLTLGVVSWQPWQAKALGDFCASAQWERALGCRHAPQESVRGKQGGKDAHQRERKDPGGERVPGVSPGEGWQGQGQEVESRQTCPASVMLCSRELALPCMVLFCFLLSLCHFVHLSHFVPVRKSMLNTVTICFIHISRAAGTGTLHEGEG